MLILLKERIDFFIYFESSFKMCFGLRKIGSHQINGFKGFQNFGIIQIVIGMVFLDDARCFEFGSENVLLIITEIKLHRIGTVSVCHCATFFLNLGTKKLL